jgi:ketosteroid isomerase-like protein
MHPNARLIETLYASLRDGQPKAAAACYAADARFEDIAFQLEGRGSVFQMWRFVCSRKVKVSFDSVVADDRKGHGHWVASYTISDSGRKVVNETTSRFGFRDGLIAEHVDTCDPMAWATQAYPFPKNLAAGLIAPLRRSKARELLERFIRENPEP